MKKFSILWIVLFLCKISTLISAQPSEEPFIPEQLLPENTLAVCVFPNVQETVAKFNQTLLGGTPVSAKIQSDFASLAEEFGQNAGFRLSEIWAIFHKSLALALVDISPGDSLNTNRPAPKFAFIADVTDSVDALKNLLATVIVPGIQAKEPTVEFRIESFEGQDVYVIANKQFQVYYTFLKHAFVLALDQKTMQKIISISKPVLSNVEGPVLSNVEGTPLTDAVEPVQNNVTGSLFNAGSYRSVVGDTPADTHTARIYVDIRNLWLTLRPYLRQTCTNKFALEQTIILDWLDQSPLQALFWTFSYKDRGGYERLFFRINTQKNLVFSTNSTGGPNTFTSDQIVPASVVYYQTGSVNLLEIWQHLATLINASSNPQQIEQFNSWVRSLEDTLHLNLEKDLLSAFDQEIAIACETREFRHKSAREKSARADFPVFILFQVKDQDGFAHTFQKVSTALQIEPQTEVYQTTEIQSLLLPGKIAPLTVYTAIVKDFCVVSLSRTVLQEVITASQQGNSLATAADYRQLSAYFPASGYAKGYINLKKLAGLLRNFLNQLDQTEPSGQDQTADSALNLTALAEQFPGMLWMTTVVRDGLLTESFSPVGGTVVGITLAWLGLSLFMD